MQDGRYALRVGRITIGQSAFMMAAAGMVGLGGGFGAVLFRAMIFGAQWLAFGRLGPFLSAHVVVFAIVIQLAIGGAVAAFVAARFAPEARGHGVPEVMEAVALRGGRMRPRVIAVKSLASAISIGFGGSCGREGPIVQIGSAIGSLLGQVARAPVQLYARSSRVAPLRESPRHSTRRSAVFFASEVILGEFAPRSFAAIVVASVVSAVIGRAFFGNHPSFNASAFVLISPLELVLYALLGILAALWATGFVNMLYFVEDAFERLHVPAWAKGALGFAGVGLIGIWYPQIFGVGYESIQQVLSEHVRAGHALLLAALKPIATSLTLGSGGSGGVFAPCLFTGAFLGDALAALHMASFPCGPRLQPLTA